VLFYYLLISLLFQKYILFFIQATSITPAHIQILSFKKLEKPTAVKTDETRIAEWNYSGQCKEVYYNSLPKPPP
jgi:hypothetical protein